MTKAHHVIQNPENWCQYYMACNVNNSYRFVAEPDAVKFCILGAICRVYSGDAEQYDKQVRRVRSKLEETYVCLQEDVEDFPGDNQKIITQWNDDPDRTHAEVYKLLKDLDI